MLIFQGVSKITSTDHVFVLPWPPRNRWKLSRAEFPHLALALCAYMERLRIAKVAWVFGGVLECCLRVASNGKI